MLTIEQLKEVLEYNHDTGLFTWIKSIGSIKAGSVAGCKNNTGYIVIMVKQRSYTAHRLAHLYMTGKFPENDIDHINHIKDDNRWVNLRNATNSQNHANQVKYKNNTSGYKGVRLDKRYKKWYATITHMNKVIHIGSYTTPQEAAEAYKKKAIELFGEFSYTE